MLTRSDWFSCCLFSFSISQIGTSMWPSLRLHQTSSPEDWELASESSSYLPSSSSSMSSLELLRESLRAMLSLSKLIGFVLQ